MQMLVWAGAAVSMTGIALLIWCIYYTVRARRTAPDDATLRARLQRAVVINLAALMISALGLMMVILGIALG